MGAELPGQRTDEVHYQLTQRADFFEEEVGLETTLKRPIINTRDEPHADARKYRRLHVIVGDANPSQVATFLKVGTTALVLAMVEDDLIPHDFEFASPVASMRHVSHDLTLREGLPLADGSTITALEVQWELLDLAKEYVDRHGTDSTGGEATHEVLRRWEHVLAGLEHAPHGTRRPARLGRQIPTPRGLPRTARPRVERRQAPGDGHPVQRHAS